MTRIENHKVGKKTWQTSQAACDQCGIAGGDRCIGSVTAPLPHGWKATLVQAGKGLSKMGYACPGCQ